LGSPEKEWFMTATSALIDIGGSSVKVTIRDNHTAKMLSHEISVTPNVEGRHIFLDSTQLFKTIIAAMNNCAESLSSGVKVEEIYISTLRQGFCLIDDEKELTPIYLNSDTSGELARNELDKYGSKKIYEETGHWFAPQLTLPKIINLFGNQPELLKHNTKLLFVHDWLVWKLTQEIVTEMTLVSAGQMAKLSEKSIHSGLLEYFDIPLSILPIPQEFASEVGAIKNKALTELSPRWSSAKVFVGGGDSHFLHMGASGNSSAKAVVSAGSSTPISLLSTSIGTSTLLQPWKSTSFDDSMYFLEGNLGYPGSFYGWLSKNVANPITRDSLNIANISKAPSVFGSCNMWNEEKWRSRPAFSILGDFSKSNSNELALGLLLDYSFALANQISALKNDGFKIDQIIITGGGASPQLQTILGSLLDISVERVATENAADNLFSLLGKEKRNSVVYENHSEPLDVETSEFLRSKAIDHALLYTEIEGIREVLENAS
jgi:sugar (pentulose or hexulose) kinase